MNTILLTNGLIYINGELKKLNLFLKNKKIAGISPNNFKANKIIDCKGKWILPGLIDPHVHFRCPGSEHKEDWTSGSKAAVSSGITTVIDMPNTNPPTTTYERLCQKREIVKKSSLVNYGFHFGATINNLKELQKVSNIASIKIYFGSTTGNLLVKNPKVISKIMEYTKVPLTIHAEDELLIQKNLINLKQTNLNPSIHNQIRNEEVAYSAVKKIIDLAKPYNPKLYFCHVSTEKEVKLIQKAKTAMTVYCEATPHHLFLNETILNKIGNLGKVNPPIRSEENRLYLYNALSNNLIDTIGTDHAPHLISEKDSDYLNAPAGIPGLETLLPLLLTEVNNNKLTISQIVRYTSENPANIFSIKNKSIIKLGYDADLVIVDPIIKYSISSNKLFSKSKWTPFNDYKVMGKVIKTIVLGSVVYDSVLGFSYNRASEVLFNAE